MASNRIRHILKRRWTQATSETNGIWKSYREKRKMRGRGKSWFLNWYCVLCGMRMVWMCVSEAMTNTIKYIAYDVVWESREPTQTKAHTRTRRIYRLNELSCEILSACDICIMFSCPNLSALLAIASERRTNLSVIWFLAFLLAKWQVTEPLVARLCAWLNCTKCVLTKVRDILNCRLS